MSAWTELRVVVPRTHVDKLTAIALAHGASGTQEAPGPGAPMTFKQPWDTQAPPLPMFCTFKAWFSPEDAPAAGAALKEETGLEIESIVVDEEDWAESWKRHHHRIAISERLRVSPPWEAVPGDLVIPPGNAFGTGDHPTTQACLGAIDDLASSCSTCLDVGCGSGVLALAATQLGVRSEGIDIETDSVRASRENATLNGLQARFSGARLEELEGPYDLVVANLFAEVLIGMAPELIRLTGKHLVLAGILADRADRVVEALSPPLAVSERIQTGEWVSLRLVVL